MKKETTLNAIEQARLDRSRLIEQACVSIGQRITWAKSAEEVNWADIHLQRLYIHNALSPEGEVEDKYQPLNENEIEFLLETARRVHKYAADERYMHFADERYMHFASGVGHALLTPYLVNSSASDDAIQESLDSLTKESCAGRIMITDTIFNEIETFHNSDGSKWEAALEVVLNATLEKETFESDDERCEFIEDFYTNPDFIQIHRFSRNGFLHHCLSYYYSATKEGGFEEHVRDYAVDDEYMYFTSGVGYAVIAQDLLGGDAAGDAVREFLNFLNGIK